MKIFLIMFLPCYTSKSKFSSQENLCLQSLGSQGSYCFSFSRRPDSRPLALFLNPEANSWRHLEDLVRRSISQRSHQKGDQLISLLCFRSSQSMAAQIIPPLRITHHVAFAVLVATVHITHRVAVIQTEGKIATPGLTNLIAGS